MNRRVIVASVGFNWQRVLRGCYGVGLYPSDVVILINSLPSREDSKKAMSTLRDRFEELGLNVVELWLDPDEEFELNVARVRSVIESYGPCSVIFLVGGGLRWLTMTLIMTAIALNTIGGLLGEKSVKVEKIRIELEEEAESIDNIRLTTRYIEISTIPKLADIDAVDYETLKVLSETENSVKTQKIYRDLIERGTRIRDLIEKLKRPRTTITRRLQKLERLGLISRKAAGRGLVYELTTTGKLIAYKPTSSNSFR